MNHFREAEKALSDPFSADYQKALAHAILALVESLSDIPLLAIDIGEDEEEGE